MTTAHTPATVLIVDDHSTFAESLSIALADQAGLTVVGMASSADEAVREAVRIRPDVIVMDILLGDDDGVSVSRRIRAGIGGALIVALSAADDWATVARAASAGVDAFATKSGSMSELVGVLRAASPGAFLVAPSLHRLTQDPEIGDPVGRALTPRESQVLEMLDNGVAPRQIARVLNISVNTCRGHIKSMYAKLGVCSQLEALAVAHRAGLVSQHIQASRVPLPPVNVR